MDALGDDFGDTDGVGSSPLLARVLPDEVKACQALQDLTGSLYPDESVALRGAVNRRRREFVTGRVCARRALAQLGVPACAISRDGRGAPLWPAGVVGSITHCEGFRAAAVAHQADIEVIGIDVEPNQPLPPDVMPLISTASERRRLAMLEERAHGPRWDRLLFSAKESVFKAWWPTMGTWLGFEEVEVVFSSGPPVFTAEYLGHRQGLGAARLQRFQGRWACDEAFVATSVVVRQPPDP